jgi:hypothetical protein
MAPMKKVHFEMDAILIMPLRHAASLPCGVVPFRGKASAPQVADDSGLFLACGITTEPQAAGAITKLVPPEQLTVMRTMMSETQPALS